MIRQILLSIGATLAVSYAAAFGLSRIFGFWEIFILTFAAQIVGFFFINSNRIAKQSIEMEQTLNERYGLLEKNFIQFECPCGQHLFEEIVHITDEPVFPCPKCSNKIKVNITITPTVVTSPLDLKKTLEAIKMLDNTEFPT